MSKDKIPKTGIDEKDLFEYMENSMHSDIDWRSGKTFGAVYYPGEKYSIAISNAYIKYMHENAFDPQLFSSILTMENKLVQQTASLFSSNQKLFGNLTSGGTESIFLSVLSARNWSNKQKNIKNPETKSIEKVLILVLTLINAAIPKKYMIFLHTISRPAPLSPTRRKQAIFSARPISNSRAEVATFFPFHRRQYRTVFLG